MESVVCSVCCVEKLRSDFYARSAQCKTCTIARVRTYRMAHIEAVRAYDRERAKLPHRIANISRVSRAWRRKYPDRQKAHNAAQRAHMAAPAACEECGRSVRLEKHHPDYTQPLLVVWLCKPCHAMADKIRRRIAG